MSHRLFLLAAFGWASAFSASWAVPARAGVHDVRLLPVRLEPVPAHVPVDLTPVVQHLEVLLHDAMLDFGLHPLDPAIVADDLDEQALTELGRDAWVVLPVLGLRGGQLQLSISVVPEGSQVLLLSAQHFEPAELEVRSLNMLRQLFEPGLGLPREPCPDPPPDGANGTPAPLRSSGRAVLELQAAALGGYVGYALQRASGSDDARLTFPLVALGAGVGLGSAVIVSEEWDITIGRAWFLSAGMLWPSVGVALATKGDQSDTNRRLLSVVGATGGITLAAAGLALGHVDEGGAAVTHSGAALGLLMGGLGEMIVKGDAERRPTHGMGYGLLAGVTVAGALATQLPMPAPSEVLLVDLSTLLGGLAGAAIGTPLLVSQQRSPTRDRVWLSGILAGTIAGGGVGYWITHGEEAHPARATTSGTSSEPRLVPQLGWLGMPFGFGVSGQW
jgi:hypothetical protein